MMISSANIPSPLCLLATASGGLVDSQGIVVPHVIAARSALTRLLNAAAPALSGATGCRRPASLSLSHFMLSAMLLGRISSTAAGPIIHFARSSYRQCSLSAFDARRIIALAQISAGDASGAQRTLLALRRTGAGQFIGVDAIAIRLGLLTEGKIPPYATPVYSNSSALLASLVSSLAVYTGDATCHPASAAA